LYPGRDPGPELPLKQLQLRLLNFNLSSGPRQNVQFWLRSLGAIVHYR